MLKQILIGDLPSDGDLIERISPGEIDIPVLLLILSTIYLVTSLSPHAKTSRLLGLRVDYFTLVSCLVIFVFPLLAIPSSQSIDRGIALSIALCMIALGLNTGRIWGLILLCIPCKDEKSLVKQVGSPVHLGLKTDFVYELDSRS